MLIHTKSLEKSWCVLLSLKGGVRQFAASQISQQNRPALHSPLSGAAQNTQHDSLFSNLLSAIIWNASTSEFLISGRREKKWSFFLYNENECKKIHIIIIKNGRDFRFHIFFFFFFSHWGKLGEEGNYCWKYIIIVKYLNNSTVFCVWPSRHLLCTSSSHLHLHRARILRRYLLLHGYVSIVVILPFQVAYQILLLHIRLTGQN